MIYYYLFIITNLKLWLSSKVTVQRQVFLKISVIFILDSINYLGTVWDDERSRVLDHFLNCYFGENFQDNLVLQLAHKAVSFISRWFYHSTVFIWYADHSCSSESIQSVGLYQSQDGYQIRLLESARWPVVVATWSTLVSGFQKLYLDMMSL